MKWNTIRGKLIVFLLLATIIPIAATMLVSYLYTSQSLKTRVAAENVNLLYQGGRNLSGLLDDLNRSTTNVYSILNLLQGGYDDVQSEARVYAVLYNIANSVPDIFQVYLYEKANRKATLVTLNTPQRSYNTDVFIEEGEGVPASVWVQPTHMSHKYGLKDAQPNYPSRHVFTLHRQIEKVPSSEVVGNLAVDVDMNAISDIVDQLYEKNREKIYIVDEHDAIIYSDDSAQNGVKLTAGWYSDQIAGSELSSGHFEDDGNVFIYQKIVDRNTSWTLIKQIPVSFLTKDANRAAGINLLLLAVSLLVIVSATIVISIRITAPIRQLVRYMNQIQTGNLSVIIPPADSNDEIGSIMNRFRDMMGTINNLILREYKLELSSKTNQLRAMQAQINPHFLNNTLQIIGTLALEMKAPQIYALLSALAKMMRYSMHNDSKVVTLREELEHVKAYIELQKERFENRFAVRYDVDDSLLELLMPKMILQPVIENYFKHGIIRQAADGEIVVAASAAVPNQAVISVSNNGAPIPEERLEQIRGELSELSASLMKNHADAIGEDPSSSSIGLANVLARLKLFCGEEARLELKNKKGQGVDITLTIPVNRQTERET